MLLSLLLLLAFTTYSASDRRGRHAWHRLSCRFLEPWACALPTQQPVILAFAPGTLPRPPRLDLFLQSQGYLKDESWPLNDAVGSLLKWI